VVSNVRAPRSLAKVILCGYKSIGAQWEVSVLHPSHCLLFFPAHALVVIFPGDGLWEAPS